MTKTVVALYQNVNDARAAVQDLIDRGFSRDNISFTVSDENNRYSSYMAGEQGDDMKTSAVAGGAGVGAVLGGIGGLLVGLGALAIPGVGPIIAAGPLASALVRAGVGAVAGGLVGGLVSIGVPREEAELYAEGVRRGHVLLAVEAPDTHVSEVTSVMHAHNPLDVERARAGWQSTETTGIGTMTGMRTSEGYRSSGSSEGSYREPGSTEADYSGTGRGFAEKDASPTPDTEAGYTGSRTSEADYSGTGRGFAEKDASPEPSAGTAYTGTRTGDAGYSGTGRGFAEENAPVTGDVDSSYERSRTQQGGYEGTGRGFGVASASDVDRGSSQFDEGGRPFAHGTPGVAAAGGATSTGGRSYGVDDFDIYDSGFRRHCVDTFSTTGRGYEYYNSAYRYGYRMASDPRYQGRQWNEIESDARHSWEADHHTPWDDVSDAVRYAWERVKEGAQEVKSNAKDTPS